MKVKFTKTRYNLTALLGWAGLVLGLIASAIQYFNPSVTGLFCLVLGLVGGGIAVTLSGPLKTVSEHWVQLHNDKQENS